MIHRAEYLHPGSLFPESTTITLEQRSIALAAEAAPESAFCFTLFDQPEAPALGPEFTVIAKPQSRSGRFYLGGQVFTAAEVESLGGHETLLSNMRANGWGRVIRCRQGNWQPFTDDDTLIEVG